jgi:hypothetical protein
MRENLAADPRFGERVRDVEKPVAENGVPVSFVARGRPLPSSGGGDRAPASAQTKPKPKRKQRPPRRAAATRKKKA